MQLALVQAVVHEIDTPDENELQQIGKKVSLDSIQLGLTAI